MAGQQRATAARDWCPASPRWAAPGDPDRHGHDPARAGTDRGWTRDPTIFGHLNLLDGHIEGFYIDMIWVVAQVIFGNPDKVRDKVIDDAERIDILDGSVDIVAQMITITVAWCSRSTSQRARL